MAHILAGIVHCMIPGNILAECLRDTNFAVVCLAGKWTALLFGTEAEKFKHSGYVFAEFEAWGCC